MKTKFAQVALLALLSSSALAERPHETQHGNDCRDAGGGVIGTLAITGQKQGQFAGGPFEVLGYTHEIVSPRDPASGLPTGKRQHKPLSVRIPVGAAAPLLMNAIVMNENLTAVTLSLYKPGTTTVGTTVKLTNANLAEFSNPCSTGFADCESIALTYQKIQWTSVDSGASAEDDWSAAAP
jgi:type VI secretion system secreted protein Hcp